MFVQYFLSLLTKKMMGAKGILFLKKDGTWDTLGIPDNFFIQPVEEMPSFVEAHDSISDARKDAWWN